MPEIEIANYQPHAHLSVEPTDDFGVAMRFRTHHDPLCQSTTTIVLDVKTARALLGMLEQCIEESEIELDAACIEAEAVIGDAPRV